MYVEVTASQSSVVFKDTVYFMAVNFVYKERVQLEIAF